MNIAPSPDERLKPDDILVIVGQKNDLLKMELGLEE